MKLRKIILFLIFLFPLHILAESSSHQNTKVFIVKVTGTYPDSQVSFAGDIGQVSQDHFVQANVKQITPFIYTMQTSFVSVKVHSTSFLPQKIQVDIIEKTKNHERLIVSGLGDRVFVQAGANGFIYLGSH